ncbi:MAG: ferrochelatase [Candidatus Sericytochromatia bacterium]|nr:MAG: ferrochelatase [Candidatus Sericytochromatia bacterium]
MNKTAIILINLGTPDSYSTKDIRKYLKEFLSDSKVIDIPTIFRFLLLNFIILPFRPSKVAPSYKEIWTEFGPPLLVYSNKLIEKLKNKLNDENYIFQIAMRYGNPSIDLALDNIKKINPKCIKIIPLFPQYSTATTLSIYDKIIKIISNWNLIPDIKFKSFFYNDDNYINSISFIGKKYLEKEYDYILFSFHGLPERHIIKSDMFNYCSFNDCCKEINEKNYFCYRAQCYQTAYKIADNLNLDKNKYSITFQSRLGKTPWIKPYTDETIRKLAKQGKKNILVFCPSFVTDCLETIFEIEIEYNNLFKSLGGNKIELVKSLNDEDFWVENLLKIIKSF